MSITLPNIDFKICNKCNQKLPISEFRLQKGKWLRNACKKCCGKDRLEWRKKHIENDRLAVRKWQTKHRFGISNRDIILAQANYTCQGCGRIHEIVLHIHHKDGQGRTCSNPNNQIENLEILCDSCHHSLHASKIRRDKYGKFTNESK